MKKFATKMKTEIACFPSILFLLEQLFRHFWIKNRTISSPEPKLYLFSSFYLNAKETTKWPKVSTVKRLKIDDSEVVSIGGSGDKQLYY